MTEKPLPTPDAELHPIVREEEAILVGVREKLAASFAEARASTSTHDTDLVALRDEIADARMEDVPALVAQMERVQAVAARRAESQGALVDPRSPYFGHLHLSERDARGAVRERDVLIGKATFVEGGLRIVDWRHAPVSQLYYRYPEGSEYEERFGDREVEGEIVVRRTVTVIGGELVRVQAPQGVFVRGAARAWRELGASHAELAGGQGSALRPQDFKRGRLGTGSTDGGRVDRHLPEIAALIDPRQFELITAPDAGIVVVQGGAGSGKTTIGLHRMAYLAYADRRRFSPDRMLVVTYGAGLASYISQVLPALGVDGVDVVTFQDWALKERKRAIPWLDAPVTEDTPSVVTRLKKHPALLHELERRCAKVVDDPRARRDSRGVVAVWAELLTDLEALRAAFAKVDVEPMTAAELTRAHRWCSDRCPVVSDLDLHLRAAEDDAGEGDEPPADDDVRGERGIDGQLTEEDERASLDVEDDALLLRITQLLRGPLRKKKEPALLAHLFVDEAQDLSPVELAVLLEQTTTARSVTLAGDTAQRLLMDNGFLDWRQTLAHLGMSHVAIEPLRIAYRSTREILEVARYALGPLADPEPPLAPRSGAPVEAHRFPDAGAAVALLGDALRPLFAREPKATVAVLARHPEQADAYYEGLRFAEVPHLRRVRSQDFAFKPGVEVTEIRQVKGLEYDYVVLVDVNASTFPEDDESRHLFHIGATRAAHQLWIIVTGQAPSRLVQPSLLDA